MPQTPTYGKAIGEAGAGATFQKCRNGQVLVWDSAKRPVGLLSDRWPRPRLPEADAENH